MKNVLFLLDYYLPNASANGVCISKIVNEFVYNGINVYLVCFKDDKRNVASDSRESIYEIKSPDVQKKFGKISYYFRWITPGESLPAEIKNVANDMFEVAKGIIEKNNIDTVICTHLPIESISVGKRIKEKFPFLKVVAYMLDSQSGGFLPRFLPKSFCRRRKIQWENKKFACFDLIILMESSRAHYEKYSKSAAWYQNAHYLDVPALCKQKDLLKCTKSLNDEIIISFVGTMSPGVRTPYALLETLSHVSSLKLRVVFAGKNTCAGLAYYLSESSNISLDIKGELPYEEAQKILAASDILLNLGNVNTNLVPSKVFEYMSIGKPIISTYVDTKDSSLPYLSKYPAVFFIDERSSDFDSVARNLEAFIKNNLNTTVPYSSIEGDLYNNTPAALYNLLS
jgi:glycosyltransferase involved in cell wall biosynthesis